MKVLPTEEIDDLTASLTRKLRSQLQKMSSMTIALEDFAGRSGLAY
jgi:hypothetical protein